MHLKLKSKDSSDYLFHNSVHLKFLKKNLPSEFFLLFEMFLFSFFKLWLQITDEETHLFIYQWE